ncbi:zinc finger BED domain-containing protein 5 [Trichonephila clavipes]|uniref:Zinc finger BED domain-containing protein 5 n=1 Tax=Trichonephila clavipes TaxID=2585209 RepID=A0A8X6UYZ1_TRICX|nr:zinc finger BED domain-containing protein 5 [Trichonephila clavipes]
MFGDNFAKELQSIPLSNDTVSRRIDDIAEDVEKQLFEVDDEFSELKTKAFRILLPFSTSYLCETGFSAVAALKTKYRSQLNIEKELRVSISNIKPSFENLCSARQAHGSH